MASSRKLKRRFTAFARQALIASLPTIFIIRRRLYAAIMSPISALARLRFPVFLLSLIMLFDFFFRMLFYVSVVLSQGFIVCFKFVLNIFQVAIDLFLIKVVLFTVLCPELGAVACRKFSSHQVEVLNYAHRFAKYFFDSFRIITAEIGNGVVVGFQTVKQPHLCAVALRCAGTSLQCYVCIPFPDRVKSVPYSGSRKYII